MEEFLGRYRNLSVLLAVVLVQIILLGYQVRTDQGSSLLREWTVRGVTPVTSSVRGVTDWFGSSWDNYFWLIGTKQDNDKLKRQVEKLKLENTGLRSTLARFGREERLIAYQQELVSKTLLAQVIGRGANSNSREVFISAGLDEGVTAGMPVITPDGIVGKVQASYPSASLVMLITDPEAGAGVLMSRSRAGGVLKGTGHTYCRVDYISHEVDVEMGEVVYTSGDDRVFPKGLRIGEVIKLDRDTDFQEIRIKPFAALDRLEEVLVITAGFHQDLPESPQAQPPQFLMPLPEKADPLRKPDAPPEQAEEGPAPAVDPRKLEQNGRVTDADRLRQYYEAITAQQGHRIGYGGPGTPAPNFNPDLTPSKPASPGAGGSTGGSVTPPASHQTAPEQEAVPEGGPEEAPPVEFSPRESAPEANSTEAPAVEESSEPSGEPETTAQPPVSRSQTPLPSSPRESAPGQTAPSQPAPQGRDTQTSSPRPVRPQPVTASEAAASEPENRGQSPTTAPATRPVADPGPASRTRAAPAGEVSGNGNSGQRGEDRDAVDSGSAPSRSAARP